MSSIKILPTEDGSHTLQNEALNETYHSTHGAIQESKHIFIEAGLKEIAKSKNEISILEFGFGTGLNAYLTLLENNFLKKKITYTTLEAFPVQMEIAAQLNYPQLLLNKATDALFDLLHSCNWNKRIAINSDFSFLKINKKMEDFILTEKYDLIYFDAFSPQTQPELWTKEIFKKLCDTMNDEGILVTYSAKGEVKRNLKAAGFKVVGLPGPIGKREITRAIKN